MCSLEKRGNLFLLTLTGTDQHRLNPTLISSIRSALASAKSQSSPGSALITLAAGNFFSNGFDLQFAASSPSPIAALNNMVDLFKPLIADLISLPMPTIAALTGHAAAAGMMLAMAHDHVIMRSDRGVLYMSEVDLGMTLPDYFVALMREKAGAVVRREVLLKGVKVKGKEAVEMGLVDKAYDSAEGVVEASVRLGEEMGKKNWNGEVMGEIRKSLYPELCGVLGLVSRTVVVAKL